MATADNPPTRRLVSIQDAAAYVGVNPRTIRRHISEGTLTGYRLGKLIRVDLDELDRLLVVMPAAHAR